MKNLLAFCLLSLLLMNCSGGLEQHRGQIESLSGEWDEVSTSITTLSDMIQATKTDWQTNLNNMNLTDEVKARISPDHLERLDSLKSTYASYGPQVEGMMKQIREFSATWTEQKNQLAALNSSLEEGKFQGDVLQNLDEVKENISAAREKTDNWEATFEAVSAELNKITEDHADLLQTAL